MGKAISLLRPPQPPREGEREGPMELRKRPRQPCVDPDFVSSPPPLLLRKRARKQAPAKRPREAAEQQRPRKRSRCAGVVATSPVAPLYPESYFQLGWPIPLPKPTHIVLRPLHPFNWYESDMWTEIAKHLYGYDLVSLSLVCRWFRCLLVDDSIWRHAFIRDLMLPASYVHPRPFHRSWRRLYAAAFDGSQTYCYHQRQRHIDGSRIGGFLLDTSCVLLSGKLPLPRWVLQDVQLSIEMMGAGVVRNARPGIWIVDQHMVQCPTCKDDGCTGVVQVLDIRHCELFLEEEFWDGTWEYEDLGEHFMDEVSATACCAIFNHNRLNLSYADIFRNTKSWIRKQDDDDDSLLKACLTPYAVAINTNLNENGGLMSKFQAMRDTSGDGRIVAIRISQQLV